MKKRSREVNLLDISQIEHKSVRADKIKTTDVNILLNRVKKKNNFFILIIVCYNFSGCFFSNLAKS